MMKYRNLAILGIILLVIIGIAFSNLEFKEKRYHQHLDAKVRPEDVVTTDEFATHLPIIDIKTEAAIPPSYKETKDENGKIIKEKNYDVVKSSLKYIQNEDTENKRGDDPVFTTNAYIRTRGRSSRSFDKKGYWLEFQNDDFSKNRDIEIDGMVADSDWVLHGPFLDKTLIRNYIAYNIVGEIMEYSPEVRFCELFLNDEYQGLYLIVEKINYNKEGRINITKTDPKSRETSFILKLDEGYADEAHKLSTFYDESGKRGISKRDFEKFIISYPSSTLTINQHGYIKEEVSKFEKTLSSFDVNNKKHGYKRYIDINSFVDYFVINEFFMNVDAGRLSTYYIKDIRGKIKMVGWDYNNIFNNYFNDMTDIHEIYSTNVWFGYLLRDKEFVQKVVTRYEELRKTYFSEEYLNNYIDETVLYLGKAIDRNYEKWGYTFTKKYNENKNVRRLKPIDRNPNSHEEAINYLKENIKIHANYLDENIYNLYARCHDSINKQYRLEVVKK